MKKIILLLCVISCVLSTACSSEYSEVTLQDGNYSLTSIDIPVVGELYSMEELEVLGSDTGLPSDLFSLLFSIDTTAASLSIDGESDNLSLSLSAKDKEDWEVGCMKNMTGTRLETFTVEPEEVMLQDVELRSLLLYADECATGESESGVATLRETVSEGYTFRLQKAD